MTLSYHKKRSEVKDNLKMINLDQPLKVTCVVRRVLYPSGRVGRDGPGEGKDSLPKADYRNIDLDL